MSNQASAGAFQLRLTISVKGKAWQAQSHVLVIIGICAIMGGTGCARPDRALPRKEERGVQYRLLAVPMCWSENRACRVLHSLLT